MRPLLQIRRRQRLWAAADARISLSGSRYRATNATVAVGELWDGNTDNVLAWLDDTGGGVGAFDFPFHYLLRRAFGDHNSGKSQEPLLRYDFSELASDLGLIGRRPELAYTFLHNHDTYRRDDQGPSVWDAESPDVVVMQGYAILLSHPGRIPWLDLGSRAGERHFSGELCPRWTSRVFIGIRSVPNSAGLLHSSRNLVVLCLISMLMFSVGSNTLQGHQWSFGPIGRGLLSKR